MADDDRQKNVIRLQQEAYQRVRKPAGPKSDLAGQPWFDRLDCNQFGRPKMTAYNMKVLLTEHPSLEGLFSLDEFHNRVNFLRAPPWTEQPPAEFDEAEGFELAAWLSDPAQVGMSVGAGAAMEAVEAIANRLRTHPVREYLEGLVWDGVPRLERLLPDYFGAPANDYTHALGPNWLVSAVARVYQPGAQVDFMVILEGGQGMGKTQAVRCLFGAWYAEPDESPGHKDFYQALVGRWGIEISEMQSFNRAEVNLVKKTITRQEDVYRPSYGRRARAFPRHCIFVGTTNEDAYLRDPSGGRRFLPTSCAEINLEGLASVRDLLWAEAVSLYGAGHPFWKDPPGAESEQDARFQEDSWTDPIERWLNGEDASANYPDQATGRIDQVTITEVMREALRLELGKHTRQDQMRVAQILRRLGWTRGRASTAAGRLRVYQRPGTDPPDGFADG